MHVFKEIDKHFPATATAAAEDVGAIVIEGRCIYKPLLLKIRK